MKNSLPYQLREIIYENNLNFMTVIQKDIENLNFTKDDINIKYNHRTKESTLELSNYITKCKFELLDGDVKDIYFANGLTLFIYFDGGQIIVTKTKRF